MSFGKFGTDREQRIDYGRLRGYRLARTREQMKKAGLGALVTWEAWNIRYITSAYVTIPTRWLEGQCVILPRNGDPHVFVSTSFSPYRLREEMPWLKGKIWANPGRTKMARSVKDVSQVVDTIAGILAEHGLTNEPFGVDGSQSELLLQEAFGAQGIKITDAKPVMFEARKIKNRDEIECVMTACSNAEAAFADIIEAIKPGVTECELVGISLERLQRK
ncbi:MAG: aminopeptidase P family N-terminal domain-containing protein [Pseudomonadota bacterium]